MVGPDVEENVVVVVDAVSGVVVGNHVVKNDMQKTAVVVVTALVYAF